MSMSREHMKECAPIRAREHHIDDGCKNGTCRKGGKDTYRASYNRLF